MDTKCAYTQLTLSHLLQMKHAIEALSPLIRHVIQSMP